jgi:hypothetical protein
MKVWPFHGSLQELLAQPGIVVAEIYPTESRCQLNLDPHRERANRIAAQKPLTRKADTVGASYTTGAKEEIQSAFGDRDEAKDKFDAFCGLIAMLQVIVDESRQGAPSWSGVEGWILGQRWEEV